jgi:hypothetical protein
MVRLEDKSFTVMVEILIDRTQQRNATAQMRARREATCCDVLKNRCRSQCWRAAELRQLGGLLAKKVRAA